MKSLPTDTTQAETSQSSAFSLQSLLEEQSRLQTPVALFAEHESEPAWNRQLIPLSAPKEGEQYAFRVDLDKCTGCKACVSACHSLNGLDENETWRDVGLIHGGCETAPYQQTITTACHHCADPACANGCPVLAYEKDEATGIVRHLDDQCIGCQYCVLKCPYDVPKYSESLGIVRKCDMCHGRLSEGEAPACVQACPTEAISIEIVSTEAYDGSAFLPAAPEPEYTQPTTSYVTKKEIPDNAAAADIDALQPQPRHTPLVWMLTLTQASVGSFVAAILLKTSSSFLPMLALSWLTLAAGIAASIGHLGKPLGAWRAFLGLKKSWLSREIVLFGSYLASLSLTAGMLFGSELPAQVSQPLLGVTLGIGMMGVWSSVMIYHDTQRPYWHAALSGIRFLGTTILFACACLALGSIATGLETLASKSCVAFATCGIIKMAFEGILLTSKATKASESLHHAASLSFKHLSKLLKTRFLLGGVGAILIPVFVAFAPISSAALPLLAFGLICTAVGEWLERSQFFQAVKAPKMPGGIQR